MRPQGWTLSAPGEEKGERCKKSGWNGNSEFIVSYPPTRRESRSDQCHFDWSFPAICADCWKIYLLIFSTFVFVLVVVKYIFCKFNICLSTHPMDEHLGGTQSQNTLQTIVNVNGWTIDILSSWVKYTCAHVCSTYPKCFLVVIEAVHIPLNGECISLFHKWTKKQGWTGYTAKGLITVLHSQSHRCPDRWNISIGIQIV